VRLTVIGCSGSYPGPDSPASCYLVEAEHDDGTGSRTWRVLLDLGSGALGVLHRYADPLSLDAVLFSHLHADHCLDLSGYYVLRKYHPTGAQPRLPVYGPSDTAGRMARAYDLPLDPGMTEEFDFRSWSARTPVTVGPFEVTPVPMDHPVEAYGLRVTAGGRTIAYTGDTAVCPELSELAHDADLLLAESSFRERDDNPPGVHLTGKECGELARAAGVRRLVLTHVPPWFERDEMLAEARSAWDGDSQLAMVGATYVL
jgi:ribonuclease BN (tRNA processing enzyme)